MKVFISWSGVESRVTAERISDWLKSFFQKNLELFVSSKDIEKGDRWAERLSAVLQDYSFGIVVLNGTNKDRPWINFEAGALSKSVTKAKLVPVLCGFTPGDLLESPLGQFQGVEATKEGLLELARTINTSLEKVMDDGALVETFDVWWERKGKPITEFSEGKTGAVKKDAQPTLRDVMARIDRTESLLADLIRASSEQASIRSEKGVWLDVDGRSDTPNSIKLNPGIGKTGGILGYFEPKPQNPVDLDYAALLKIIESYEAINKNKKP